MKQKRTRRGLRTYLCSMAAVFMLLFMGSNVYAYTTDTAPGVAYSPDGQAFTIVTELPEDTDPSRNASYWIEMGEEITTSIPLNPPTPGVGQHLYDYERRGYIPVYKWVCEHKAARCIHDRPEGERHGLPLNANCCGDSYWSGWMAYCADCGQMVKNLLHYISPSVLPGLEFYNVDMEYYYQCPHCTHVEQMHDLGPHTCHAISYNMYAVKYDKNASSAHGFMGLSFHMYNNATMHDGETIVPDKYLSLCTFTRSDGYVFSHWSTNPDGSGTIYGDGQEIYNLSDEEFDEDTGEGMIILYAQWRRSRSTLIVDANGGTYIDSDGVRNAETPDKTIFANKDYNTILDLSVSKLTAPLGYKVSFNTHGGTACGALQPRKQFDTWVPVGTLNGMFRNNRYAFKGEDGTTDTIKATYYQAAITLPNSTLNGKHLVGWYKDAAYTQYVGLPGDLFTPSANVTLHAKWADGLVLYSTPDLAVPNNTYKGGVDLTWQSAITTDRVFKVYQKLSTESAAGYDLLTDTGNVGNSLSVNKAYSYTGTAGSYTIPYNGYYTFTGYGAQGSAGTIMNKVLKGI